MIDSIVTWATILSPVISTIAIIVSLRISRKSSQDAQRQINEIRNLLDVFIAVHNLDIFEAQRKYQQQLIEIDEEIEDAKTSVETAISPFIGGALIDRIHERENQLRHTEYLNQLLAKRKEIETQLALINNYIKKTTK
jgi:hypothetical protein